MTTKYTDAPRTRVMTPAALNNGVHENHSIGQTMAIDRKSTRLNSSHWKQSRMPSSA